MLSGDSFAPCAARIASLACRTVPAASTRVFLRTPLTHALMRTQPSLPCAILRLWDAPAHGCAGPSWRARQGSPLQSAARSARHTSTAPSELQDVQQRKPLQQGHAVLMDPALAMLLTPMRTPPDSTASVAPPAADPASNAPPRRGVFACTICGAAHCSHDALVSHMASAHCSCCSVCGSSMPNWHLLGVHESEAHSDAFRSLSRGRPSYRCLVPDCSGCFWSSAARGAHIRSAHGASELAAVALEHTVARTADQPMEHTVARTADRPGRAARSAEGEAQACGATGWGVVPEAAALTASVREEDDQPARGRYGLGLVPRSVRRRRP